MNIEEVREYCLSKRNAEESFPFGEDTLVFKVNGKIFVLVSLNAAQMNLKCDPDLAIELREQYSSVLPGYHMNKKYWNTVLLNGSIPSRLIREWVDLSYDLIAQKKKKK
jgi:predicted DNA-binding protein (MmcQ/YjbR family)